MATAALANFKTRAKGALADRTLKVAIDRTTGNAERKRAAALAVFPEFPAARERGKKQGQRDLFHVSPHTTRPRAESPASRRIPCPH